MPTIVQSALADGPGINGFLLNGATAVTSTATWFRLTRQYPFTITITGTFVATVKILGSNLPSTPPDTAAPALDAVTTVPYFGTFTSQLEWITVIVTAYTSGTIFASIGT